MISFSFWRSSITISLKFIKVDKLSQLIAADFNLISNTKLVSAYIRLQQTYINYEVHLDRIRSVVVAQGLECARPLVKVKGSNPSISLRLFSKAFQLCFIITCSLKEVSLYS